MSYLLASELSYCLAAIAPVGGPMGTETLKPKRPVSVIHFHGTDDEHAPFNGSKGKDLSGTDIYSVKHSIQSWVKVNCCEKESVVTKFPDTAKVCAEVVLIEIESWWAHLTGIGTSVGRHWESPPR